jgi:protein-disulfide isomerase
MISFNLNNKLILLIKILLIYSIFFTKSFTSESDQLKNITEGNENAKIEILVYESLTCPHCAEFHKKVYPDLKKNFIDKGLVKIEFKNFPLDIAGLNASKIAHCKNDGGSEILHFLFYNQNTWTKGETIDEINYNLKEIIIKEKFGIDFTKCINNKKIEDHILEGRIEAVKKFEINSTPTLIINNKKFDKPLTYKNLKKAIEKLI